MAKNVVVYKEFIINGCKFKIRKYRGSCNELIYSVFVSKGKGARSLGSYKNPRVAINSVKEYACIFEDYYNSILI